MRILTRLALAGALTLAAACHSGARAFTIEDLLATQAFGQVVTDPTGRWAVFEETDPYASAARFDYDIRMDWALSRLKVVDLAHPAAARPLLPDAEGPGLVAGPFAPDGRRLAVYRLRGDRWQLGVATVPDGGVTWLALTPEDPTGGRAVQWLDGRRLLVLARPEGDAPWQLRRGFEAARVLPPRWAATARGGVAATVYGSGSARQTRPPSPTRALHRVDLDTGRDDELARGIYTDFEKAPDGRRVALLAAGVDVQPQADEAVQGAHGSGTQRHSVRLLDLATRRVADVCPGDDVLETLLAWSPDGRSLLVFSRRPDDPWAEGRLQRVTARDGGCTAIVIPDVHPEVELRPDRVRAGWLGEAPVVYARDRHGRADWYRLGRRAVRLTAALDAVPPTVLALSASGLQLVADGGLWRIDPAGRARRLAAGVTAGPARRGLEARLAAQPPPGDTAAVISAGADGAELRAWGRGAQAGAIPLPAGARLAGFSPAQGVALVRRKQPNGVEDLVAVTRAGDAVALARINAGRAEVTPPRIAAIRHPGPDGEPLTSWLFLPPPSPDGRAPPLVISPYLGDRYAAPVHNYPLMGEFAISIPALVGHGYAVLMPSLPKGRTDGAPWRNVAERLLAIVDAAEADPETRGLFDPKRLALWGNSYGGYTVAHAIGQSDRFRAAVISGAPTDLVSLWGTFQPSWRISPKDGVMVSWPTGWTETAQGGLGGPPWRDPQRYVSASPIFGADRIHTPLLILQGEQDTIGLAQGEELFSALYRQDRDAQMVTYWGEGHMLGSPAVVRDRYARAFHWLDERFTP